MQARAPRLWRRFRRRRLGMLSLAGLVLLAAVAVLRPVLASRLPIVCRHEGRLYFPGLVGVVRSVPFASAVVEESRPFSLPSFDVEKAVADSSFAVRALIPYDPLDYSSEVRARPSRQHWLGTDDLGRDVAARLVHGTAVSLKVGLGAMALAGLVGIVLGAWAGYAGGIVDVVVSRLIELVMCFPVFFLILAVMVWVEEPGVKHVVLVIGLTAWTPIARLMRAEMLRLRGSEFAVAARALGAGPVRVLVRHLLPNAMAPVAVTITFGVGHAILIEAALSWLGFGVPPPAPSWGVMLRSAYDQIHSSPFLVYPPCVAIFITVLMVNWLGEAVRDAADPRGESENLVLG